MLPPSVFSSIVILVPVSHWSTSGFSDPVPDSVPSLAPYFIFAPALKPCSIYSTNPILTAEVHV